LITPSEHKIVVSIIGDVDHDLVFPVCRDIERIFGYPTEPLRLSEDISFAFNPERLQYHSTLILERLAAVAPDDAVRVLAVTKVDLFIPVLTYVYGEAQLGGKACIISTHRLCETLNPVTGAETLRFRIFKEAVHELGHTFNLKHCKDQTCIMHYCRNIKDVDRKSGQLCRYCQILLEDEIKRLPEEPPPTF
jgi:archaemetzincin